MISAAALQQKLSTQFNLHCFIDLAQITSSPSRAYQQFHQCYQAAFDNNDRLVFYTSYNIPDSFLEHLYKASDLLDISNFFVLICSPSNLTTQLQSAAELYSADQTSFQTLQVDLEKTTPLDQNYFVPDSLCPLPWMHLEVSSAGEIRPCCVYSSTVDNLKHATLNEAFNSDRLQLLRKEFLKGKQPLGCSYCWNAEKKGLTSNRTYHVNFLKKELMINSLESPTLKSLDLKPGNTCNFKCRICNPKSSSLYAQEANQLYNISVKEFNWTEDSSAIEEILSLSGSLTNLDLYGGEPFLIKPLTRLIAQIVSNGDAKNIRLHYNSNGSIYPAHLIEHWKQFQHIDIQFSIDNIGQRFELERGGQWHQVDSNIKQLLALKLPNVTVSIMPAISIMNVFYLNELLDWAHSLGLTVNPLYVSTPREFDLKNLTNSAKKLVIQKLQHLDWSEAKSLVAYLASVPDSDGKEFVKLCSHFDHIRNQDFGQSHPEIAVAMGYSKQTK